MQRKTGMIRVFAVFLILLKINIICINREISATTINVFAASSLAGTLDTASKLYKTNSEQQIRYSFASSSALAKQIKLGAPASIFISANKKWLNYLNNYSVINKKFSRVFLLNRLVIAANKFWRIQHSSAFPYAIIRDKFKDNRFSIGDPNHVPSGFYAQQGLSFFKIWKEFNSKSAPMHNARAALAMIERNETPIGVVYKTDTTENRKVDLIFLFPSGSHPPIEYSIAIVNRMDSPAIRELYSFLTGPLPRPTYIKNGFEIP